MRNSTDVIAQVINGHGPQLAAVLEVLPSRCYEILSTDNPYPKTKRLIRAIAQVSPDGIGEIKADMDALFADLLPDIGNHTEACPHELHRESFEAVDSVMRAEVPDHVKEKELRELISSASQHLRAIQRKREPVLPLIIREKAQAMNGNGRAK